MTKYVMLNGAPGAGKSILAQAVNTMGVGNGTPHIPVRSLAEPLRRLLYSFVGSSLPQNDETYADLKKTRLVGPLLGRDLMIGWGFGTRKMWEDAFPQILRDSVSITAPAVVLVDDLGFQNEYEFFGDDAHVIYLEDRIQGAYQHGQQFRNDSRYCLRDAAVLTDPTVEELYEYCLGLMDPQTT